MSELHDNRVLFTLWVVPGYYWWGNSKTVPLSVTVFYPCCFMDIIGGESPISGEFIAGLVFFVFFCDYLVIFDSSLKNNHKHQQTL